MTLNVATPVFKCLIDGQWVDADSGKVLQVINPATELPIAEVPECGAAEVDRAVAAAVRAFPAWRQTTPGRRSDLLLELGNELSRSLPDFVRLESENAGKPLAAAQLEVEHALNYLRFFAGAARTPTGLSVGEYEVDISMMIRREPIGVAGLITPWNYPLNIAIWKLGPALAAGNTCVVKPSELTPITTLMLAEVCSDIFPRGVVNVVTGSGETAGAALVRNPQVGIISITGATETGKQVAKSAADSLKRVHLELGGKAPVIVFPDADIQDLARRLKGGAYWNAGQDCTAATRLIVANRVYDQVIDAVVEMSTGIKVGVPGPDEPLIDMGPLISASQKRRVLGFIEDLHDGTVLVGPNPVPSKGYFVRPTVIAGVTQASDVVQREVFGPVLTVQRFAEAEEAIRMANSVPYGLAASVWTRDIGYAMDAVRLLDFGTVWVNDHGTFIPEMPHGGFKESGYGKDLSVFSLEEFSRIKNVMVHIDRKIWPVQ